jgi:hypothetical protein
VRTVITALSMAALVMLAMNQGPASAQGATTIAMDISAGVMKSESYSLIAAMPERRPGDKFRSTDAIALLNADSLADISAGESDPSLALTNQTLTATSTGNMLNATSVTTGDITFGANVFSGFNGVGNFVINTGNNNVLQGSLSVTVQQ